MYVFVHQPISLSKWNRLVTVSYDILAKHYASKRYHLINEQKFLCFIVMFTKK